MQVIIPTITTQGGFTRASSAGYWDSTGTWQTVGNDVIRIGYDPLNLSAPPAAIVELQVVNKLLNSAALSTQSIAVTAVPWTVSFYGTGTIVLSGVHSHTIVGLGASPIRTSYTFTPSAGTLTLTVTGTCTMAQAEIGLKATSWIVTTGGIATRTADILTNGLVYSNIAEPESGWPTWSSATGYVIGNQVTYSHRRYTCVVNNTNRNPLTDTTLPTAWTDAGPSNRYAMFDKAAGTKTVSTGTSIVVVIQNGAMGGIAAMEMGVDKLQIAITNGGGPIEYSANIDTSNSQVYDWLQYFTTPITRLNNYVALDIPPFYYGIATIVMSVNSGTASCGNLVAGTLFDFGANSTSTSPTLGIIDYSVKTTDVFGVTTVLQRGFAKRMNTKMIIPSVQVDNVASMLTSVRATPCVWVGSGNDYQSLMVYGTYKDWEVDIAYKTISYCSLQIDGWI